MQSDAADPRGPAIRVHPQHGLGVAVDLVQVEDPAHLRVAGVLPPLAGGVGDHPHDLLGRRLRALAQIDGVPVALRHLSPIGAGHLGRLREDRLRLREDLAVVEVELPDDLARELDVRDLVDAHRDAVGLVQDDVGGLQDRVAEEAVEGQLAIRDLLADLLVAGRALQPAHWRDHPEEEEELGVLLHLALDEERRPLRVDAGGDEVDEHLALGALDDGGVVVVRGERVPVGAEEVTAVLRLQPHPVRERAVEVAEVKAPGGAHAGDDDGSLGFGHGQAIGPRRWC